MAVGKITLVVVIAVACGRAFPAVTEDIQPEAPETIDFTNPDMLELFEPDFESPSAQSEDEDFSIGTKLKTFPFDFDPPIEEALQVIDFNSPEQMELFSFADLDDLPDQLEDSTESPETQAEDQAVDSVESQIEGPPTTLSRVTRSCKKRNHSDCKKKCR